MSLTVVGTGIKFLSHLTTEAKNYITAADKLYYLVNETNCKQWLQQQNPNAESLDSLYQKYPVRADSYAYISQYLVESLQQHEHVCVALYGHPAVFAKPALDAVLKARALGHDARVLPGISAEDCLFADLLFDPGAEGCQSFEATDFIIYRRQFDPSCHLILWQVGFMGEISQVKECSSQAQLSVLADYLKAYYPDSQPMVIYEAAQLPGEEASIQHTTLAELVNGRYSAVSTLYIPPAYQREYSKQQLNHLI